MQVNESAKSQLVNDLATSAKHKGEPMPELLGIVESLEEVPEHLRSHYNENEDGKFVADMTSLSNAYERQKEKNKSLEGRAKSLEGELNSVKSKYEGFNQEHYKELLELEASIKNEREEANRKKLEEQGEYEKLRTSMVKQHKEEVSGLSAEKESLQNQIQKLRFEKAQSDAIVELKSLYNKHEIDKPHFLEASIKERMKFEEGEDGSIRLKVLDSSGNEMKAKIVDGERIHATLEDLVQEYVNDDKWALAMKANPAMGPDAGSGKAKKDLEPTTITNEELFNMPKEEYDVAMKKIQSRKMEIVD